MRPRWSGASSRVITFRDGKVSSTNADAPLPVERRDDWTIVRIGAVEIQEIPDAFVLGEDDRHPSSLWPVPAALLGSGL